MADFQFDTSGMVRVPTYADRPSQPPTPWEWSDLSPFCQGYVEALLQHLWEVEREYHLSQDLSFGWNVAFSDLSPSALALILKDCEAWCRQKSRGEAYTDPQSAPAGRSFWSIRNHPHVHDGVSYPEGFPPLLPSLDEEGKVQLGEAS